MAATQEEIDFIINHVFLPRKLPHANDSQPHCEHALLRLVADAATAFADLVSQEQRPAVHLIAHAVEHLITARYKNGVVDIDEMRKAIKNLATAPSGTVVPFHIVAQNAGVILTKASDGVIFEAFELSPLNEAVMSTKGRLRRSFPGPAICISTDTFEDAEFQSVLASTLAKMCSQKAVGMTPTVRKSQNNVQEDRDTSHPGIVTELLLGILSPLSSPLDVKRIWKNTREEVLWQDTSHPWRRSPLWLLLRVLAQLQFTRTHASISNEGYDCRSYKLFMIHIMATVLDKYLQSGSRVDTDKLCGMISKIIHRISKLKLDRKDEEPRILFAKQVLGESNAHLKSRWTEICTAMSGQLGLERLKQLDFKKDATLALPDLDTFLALIAARPSTTDGRNFLPTADLLKFPAESLPFCTFGSKAEYKLHNLQAFEEWVGLHLPRWTKDHVSEAHVCQSIKHLMQNYYGVASSCYIGNPEAFSLMILTSLELWITCDKSAIAHLPLLADYNPGLPLEVVRALLVPQREHMERLRSVESYLEKRQSRAQYPKPGLIFTEFGSGTSFGERYFNQSVKHQQLQQTIENKAHLDRQHKREELDRKKASYDDHMRLFHKLNCDYVQYQNHWGDWRSKHSSGCKKHMHQSRANSITIDVHEWPLPKNQKQLKSVVFELDPPPVFCEWRNATLYLLLDVLKSQYSSWRFPSNDYRLAGCRLLKKYYQGGTHRICLLSEVKAHVVTHRSSLSISDATEQYVCRNNGLDFRYFDTNTSTYTSSFTTTEAVLQRCTYDLPKASSAFHQFIYRRFDDRDSTPNHVIATQSECPDHFSLAEYRALANIPIGHRIGWENMLAQVRSPLVDLKKPEVSFVFLQTMYQAGPADANQMLRSGHAVLANTKFTGRLLSEVREAAKRIEENWESLHALGVLTSLTCRQLSLTSSSNSILEALQLLSELRNIALKWLSTILSKLQDAENDLQRAEFRDRMVEAALVCCGTFNTDDEHVRSILSGPDGQTQASILIHCAILIHDNYSSKYSRTHGNLISILHRRWQKLSFRAYPLLAELIIKQPSYCCLDDSIKEYWPAYDRGDAWRLEENDIDHWVSSNTSSRSRRGMRLHYNLLTGTLLVDGQPLSRLPLDYEQHTLYGELFGQKVFQIIPSSTPGMRFCAQGPHRGYSVQFGRSASGLIVQATKNDRTFEILPRELLGSRLPETFLEDYSHWYEAASDEVVFRKRSNPWKADGPFWVLSRDGTGWKLDKHGSKLVSPASPTGRTVASVFSPIQAPLQINIVLAENNKRLEIELPRLQLDFYLEGGTSSVISHQLRGLQVDSTQFLGALVGLKTKLVLRNPLTSERKVLIPAGIVSIANNHSHVSVTIASAPTSPYVYKIDPSLQRLTDSGDLQSKLFLCYLHGLTSFCLPDPLTCRTGTEQALSILKSAAVKSFPLLTAENLSMLQAIDSLTPRRVYYPPHLQVMQTVEWNKSLPSLSQHSHFHNAVTELLGVYQSTQLFHPDEFVQSPSIGGIDQFLLDRDSLRSSKFRISCFGAEDFTTQSDRVYLGRDEGQSSGRAREVQVIATMLYSRDSVLLRRPAHLSNLAGHILKKLKIVGEVTGPSNLASSLPPLEYNSRWLEDEHINYWAKMWCWLHQESKKQLKVSLLCPFQVVMWLATMAFADKADLDLLHAAAAMLIIPAVQAITPPERCYFSLGEGDCVKISQLRVVISQAEKSFDESPENRMRMPMVEGETNEARYRKRESLYRQNKTRAVDQLIRHLSEQFPTSNPSGPTGEQQRYISQYINIAKAMSVVQSIFTTWNDNRTFGLYLQEFGEVMNRQVYQTLQAPTLCFERPACPDPVQYRFITSQVLFSSSPPQTIPESPRLPSDRLLSQRNVMAAKSHLETLVQRLEDSPGSRYEQQYAMELRESANRLNSASQSLDYSLAIDKEQLRPILEEHLSSSERHMSQVLDTIMQTIRTGLGDLSFAEDLFQSPRLSPVFLLQQLSKHGWAVGGGWTTLPVAWRTWIVAFGRATAQVQRAKRLLWYLENDQENDVIRELQNEGHTNWSPLQNPEALLLEIENNLTIREVQADIAENMLNPPDSRNSVMQLNMGEGKSSVIVPVVSSALADGFQLVRVIVAKPQSRQMFHMLMLTIGGMINRRIFHLPFSRAIRLRHGDAIAIQKQCTLCQKTGGIMLLQPEQILSFKLMGLETQISGQESISRSLLQTQYMFNTKSRDIVDESDENFSVKFELIYPLGTQCSIDFAPERWVLIQYVLDLVRDHARAVFSRLPDSIYIRGGNVGCFPRIRLLKPDATTMLTTNVAKQICTKGLPGFPISRQDLRTREAVMRYISEPQLSAKEIADVEKGPFWSESSRGYLWLLRGLFAKGILAFVYGQKRWKVNYGLDRTRNPPTLLAVPYRAKDSPTPRSEFSHPDVVIALTCNSYYYQGLNDEELFLAFDHLLTESDQADVEYDDWKQDSHDLLPAFRQLIGINLKDTVQCKKHLFPSFRYSKRTIDYYLEHIVFPKHMKEFPKKLTASGWDLGAVKTYPTTGFSGTIDSRKLLPLDVSYLDLPAQKHTNARVLEYLLRPENSVVLLPEPPRTVAVQMSDAEALLKVVLAQNDPKLRVILDVGAQILELSNDQVARSWLRMARKQDSSVLAAIYFDEKENLMVLDFKGAVSPLQTSPYIDQLYECLVFLDEAHTRGTDLRLPSDYKAAVTIGPSLTKDRLVQACMRMRKLGKGQSVVFCVPTEVQRKIQEFEVRRLASSSEGRFNSANGELHIGVLEVLHWCIGETIVDLQKSMPLWATQGKRFDRQEAYWEECTTDSSIELTSSQANQFLEDEAETLEHRYHPHPRGSFAAEASELEKSKRLRDIKDRCLEVEASQIDEATLQEEQERELSPEIEEERQIERPDAAKPARHSLHAHLQQFVSSGSLPKDSSAVMPAFKSLAYTSGTAYINIDMFPKDILVTADFVNTIQESLAGRFVSDAYQRPVQWILSSQPRDWSTVVIISPYEANQLLPSIRRSKYTTLHLYCARPNQEIKPLDHLDLFTTPSLPKDWSEPFPLRLKVQLNLFAGQLYFKSLDEYFELCRMLRLSHEEASKGVVLDADGFIRSASSVAASQVIRASTLTKSPVKFLKVFLSKTRRDCQSIEKTHLGKVLSGALLSANDFPEDQEEESSEYDSDGTSCGD